MTIHFSDECCLLSFAALGLSNFHPNFWTFKSLSILDLRSIFTILQSFKFNKVCTICMFFLLSKMWKKHKSTITNTSCFTFFFKLSKMLKSRKEQSKSKNTLKCSKVSNFHKYQILQKCYSFQFSVRGRFKKNNLCVIA